MTLASISSLFRLISLAAVATVAQKDVLVGVGGVLTFGSSCHALSGPVVKGLLAWQVESARKLLATSANFGAGNSKT